MGLILVLDEFVVLECAEEVCLTDILAAKVEALAAEPAEVEEVGGCPV